MSIVVRRPRSRAVSQYVSKKQVSKMIERKDRQTTELNRHVVADSYATLSYSGVITDLSAIAQGTAETNRVGSKLQPQYMDIRGYINGETSSGLVRYVVFRWDDDSTPTAANILKYTGDHKATSSPYLIDNRSKYKVYYDKVFAVSNNGTEMVNIQKHIKLPKTKHIDYTGSATSGIHKIWALAITDRVLASSPTILVVSELRFTDK